MLQKNLTIFATLWLVACSGTLMSGQPGKPGTKAGPGDGDVSAKDPEQGKPTDEGEGIPGYLTDPGAVSVITTADGKVIAQAGPGSVATDRGSLDQVRVSLLRLGAAGLASAQGAAQRGESLTLAATLLGRVRVKKDGSFRLEISYRAQADDRFLVTPATVRISGASTTLQFVAGNRAQVAAPTPTVASTVSSDVTDPSLSSGTLDPGTVPATVSGPAPEPTQLLGVWETACAVKASGSTLHVKSTVYFYDENPTTIALTTVIPELSYTLAQVTYSDPQCLSETYRENHAANASVTGNELTLIYTGASIISSVEATTSYFVATELCGIANWVTKLPSDVTGKTCSEDGDPNRRRPSKGEPAKRAIALDSGVLTIDGIKGSLKLTGGTIF